MGREEGSVEGGLRRVRGREVQGEGTRLPDMIAHSTRGVRVGEGSWGRGRGGQRGQGWERAPA